MDELSAAGTSKHVPRPGPENPGKGERTEERSSIVSRILLTPDGLRPIWRLRLDVSSAEVHCDRRAVEAGAGANPASVAHDDRRGGTADCGPRAGVALVAD